jgi:hypothetical protein
MASCASVVPEIPPEYLFGGTSWDEERLEVLESVVEAMRRPGADATQVSTCQYLWRHVIDAEGRFGCD